MGSSNGQSISKADLFDFFESFLCVYILKENTTIDNRLIFTKIIERGKT